MVELSPLLAGIGGFAAGAGAVGVPALKWLFDTRRDAKKAVRLLEGEEEVEHDGVLDRLRRLEQRVDVIEEATDRAG